jgi:hypothetical protein
MLSPCSKLPRQNAYLLFHIFHVSHIIEHSHPAVTAEVLKMISQRRQWNSGHYTLGKGEETGKSGLDNMEKIQ